MLKYISMSSLSISLASLFCCAQEVEEGPVGLVLEATSFYAEAGGQVADTGSIVGPSGAEFDVQDAVVGPCFVANTDVTICVCFG